MKCGECQSKEGLSKREIVVWEGLTQTVQVCNIEKGSIYLLITNLIEATIADPKHQQTQCPQCPNKISKISYKIKINSVNRESELSFFKYCILVLDSATGAYKKTIGTNQNQLYLKGNLVAKHLIMRSQKKQRQSHQSYIFDVQKKVKHCYTLKKELISEIDPFDMIKEIRKNELFQAAIQRESLQTYQDNQTEVPNAIVYQKSDQSLGSIPKWKASLGQKQNRFVEPLNLQMFKKAPELKEYNLFVIKMQKQIQNLYRTQMLHQYVWQQQETDFVMKQVSLFFGQYQTVQQKRRYMCFTFKKQAQNTNFQEKWNNISREILLRKQKIVEGKIINYYIFSKQQILPNYFLTNKLFLLPYTSPILDLCLADPWAVVAAVNYVLFIHAYQPMEHFQHQSKVSPIKLALHKKNPSLLLILHKEGVSCYKLAEKVVTLQSVCFTSFLQPHTIQFMSDSLILAGIDYQQKQFKRTISGKRMIYKIEDKFRKIKADTSVTTSTKAQLQNQFQVLNVQSDKKHIPISNIVAVPNREVLACTFLNKFLLFSKHGQKLVEVQLKSTIKKALFLPFMFNLFNFLVTTENNQGVRIGVESYGNTLGAELQKLKLQKVRDASVSLRESAKFELLIVTNQSIIEANYLKEQSQDIIRQQSGKIIFLSSDSMGIVYLIDLQHSFELKYLEI